MTVPRSIDKRRSSVPAVHVPARRILLSLYLVEASALLLLVGLYKAPVYDWTLLFGKAGVVILAGGAGLLLSSWMLVSRITARGAQARAALAFGVTTNLLTVFMALVVAEATVRLVAKRTPEGIRVGSVLLKPTWSELVAQSREVLDRVTSWDSWDASYFVFDPELGWTVGSDRQTPDGLYFSSVEGIRSDGPNVRMASVTPSHRVALVGDSNAFSFEVPFAESWGRHLQRLLGGDVQVLNFGVDGYGIDQMVLRYERDVRPWRPQVVLVGFVGHDLQRTLAVYPFVSFGWPGYVVKPRFVAAEGELELLNVPLPAPGEILDQDSIHQLPFVEYDRGYGTQDWSWRQERLPMVARFLTSRFPRWPPVDPVVSPAAARELNGRLLVRLVEAIEQDEAIPIVVLLSESEDALDRLAQEVLSGAGIPFLRVTECLQEVPDDRRLVASGNHYTGLANEAIARCTAPAVARALRR